MYLAYITDFTRSKLATGAAESTVQAYKRVLTRFSEYCPDFPPTVEQIEEYLNARRKMGLKKISVEGDYRVLSVFFNWCYRREKISKNPIDELGRFKRTKNTPKPVPKAKLKALFDAIETAASLGDRWAIRDRAIFRLAYDTGARASTLGDMVVQNLDISGRGIYVEGVKADKSGWLFFGPTCAIAVRQWLLIHPGGPWLFVNQHEEKMTRRRVYVALQGWCKQIGHKMTVHQLRHSYATHAIRNGIDLRVIQAQMMHSDLNTTAQYLAASDEDRRRAHFLNAPGENI